MVNKSKSESIRLQTTNQAGLTLVELIISIVVLTILTAIATAKISSTSITVGQQADLFAADIRHAQSLAINWGCELTITVTASPGQYVVTSKQAYAGKPCSVAAAVIKDPSTNQNFSVDLNNGVQFSGNAIFHFDGFGRPIDAAGNILTSDSSVDISSGGVTYRVTINQLSGYVSVVKV